VKLPSIKSIDDLETIKIMADERRLALLRLLVKPQTVKEISAALDIPQSQLYYHVNLLEKHALIQVVATNIVSGIIEKQYQATAQQFHIRNPMLMGDAISSAETSAFFSAALDETRNELRQAFKHVGPRATTEPPLHPFVARKLLRLTPEQLRAFHARLDTLIKECDQLTAANAVDAPASVANADMQDYYLTVAFYQSVDDVPPA
jgi:DNA-binding transcriptional ArsR family regulator